MSEPNPPESECDRTLRLLSLRIDGEASPADEQAIADHLPGCAACRAAQAVDEAVRVHLKARAGEAPSPGFGDGVTAAALQVVEQRGSVRRLLRRTAAAAALLCAVSAGWIAFQKPQAREPGPGLFERTKMAVIVPNTRLKR